MQLRLDWKYPLHWVLLVRQAREPSQLREQRLLQRMLQQWRLDWERQDEERRSHQQASPHGGRQGLWTSGYDEELQLARRAAVKIVYLVAQPAPQGFTCLEQCRFEEIAAVRCEQHTL